MTALFLLFAELAFYRENSVFEVNMFPSQTKNLSLSQSSKQRDFIKVFMGAALYLFQERCNLFFLQRVHFFFDNTGKCTGIRRIDAQITDQHCLKRERKTGFHRERWFIGLLA